MSDNNYEGRQNSEGKGKRNDERENRKVLVVRKRGTLGYIQNIKFIAYKIKFKLYFFMEKLL